VQKELSQAIESIQQINQKTIGLHRQLLDTVRAEKEALVGADLKGIQETTAAKEAIVEAIRRCEADREKITANLALSMRKPLREFTLQKLIIMVQGEDGKLADLLRSTLNALTILLQRIKEQSDYNSGLIEKSLEHVNAMKRNVIGEAAPRTSTYDPHGNRVHGGGNSRILSKEV